LFCFEQELGLKSFSFGGLIPHHKFSAAVPACVANKHHNHSDFSEILEQYCSRWSINIARLFWWKLTPQSSFPTFPKSP